MMSELTRYAVWHHSDHVEDVDGQWVRASEAEAEITRLKAELESTKRGHSVQREALRKQLTQEREDRGGQEPPTPLAIPAEAIEATARAVWEGGRADAHLADAKSARQQERERIVARLEAFRADPAHGGCDVGYNLALDHAIRAVTTQLKGGDE